MWSDPPPCGYPRRVPQATDPRLRIHIRDQLSVPGRFPLQRLLRETCSAFGVPSASTVSIHRCWGYGLEINALDDRWPSEGHLAIAVAELDALTEGVEGWFYDLQASLLDERVSFGLFDSTLMYLEGPTDGVEKVARAFAVVEWLP